MTPIIRAATMDDLELLALLFDGYRQFYERPPDLEGARAFLRERLQHDDSALFLAVAGERPYREGLGFVQLYPSFSSLALQRIWVLNDLFVTPEARRRGLGRALMEAARTFAEATGAGALTLQTQTLNAPAKALYDALGYQLDDAFDTYTLTL